MILRVALDVPAGIQSDASGAAQDVLYDYRCNEPAVPGQRVIVPWGRQTIIGLIVAITEHSEHPAERLRSALAVLDDVAPLSDSWFALMRFAAGYYQRSLGEVSLPALPSLLRRATSYRTGAAGTALTSRSMALLRKRVDRQMAKSLGVPFSHAPGFTLTDSQARCVAVLGDALDAATFQSFLLHGVTGSGKTEIYLRAIARALALDRQCLVLVPEINLTPQLATRFSARFDGVAVSILHSGMADAARAANWLMAHEGKAAIVLGTRTAVLCSMPRLGLVIVDEEHDTSFKQQEGLRYSARDLAVMRARQLGCPVILGSATPSMESWLAASTGRYRLLSLPDRAAAAATLPTVTVIGTEKRVLEHGFTEELRGALAACLERKEQSLIYINRRGYAPVLSCAACGWTSDCMRCSAHVVFHKSDGRLHCHHCGLQLKVPHACPDCGNVDVAPLGRGTQRVEETLASWFPAARIARIDRDTTTRRGSAQSLFDAVHAGEIDILVGTQMVAKGHDFRALALVGVLDADGALFSQDFRAAERLFANLVQVAGRAGRADKPGHVLIQTRFRDHPLFRALVQHDFGEFAATTLAERRQASLPPYSFQAVLRAEAKTIIEALGFLEQCASIGQNLQSAGAVALFDPVPMSMVRIANSERAQLLVESTSRRALQTFLTQWVVTLNGLKTRVHWHLEVDPSEI